MCNGMTREQVNAKTNRHIQEYGRSIVYVEGNESNEPYGYTVGLSKIGHPEFLVRGLNAEDTIMMLNGFSESVLTRGEKFGQGHTSHWRDGRLLYFSTVSGRLHLLIPAAYSRYAQRTRLLEISFVGQDVPYSVLAARKN
ncbi:DUF4262 domain-containing protein [Glutamicibacter sp. NPDC087344]|uniref:DUF4262 domain-containing protein n=1 Tax=Glutamicibacter sp. NPDC087344 TaxID=3363994 RepID=UPI0038086CB1